MEPDSTKRTPSTSSPKKRKSKSPGSSKRFKQSKYDQIEEEFRLIPDNCSNETKMSIKRHNMLFAEKRLGEVYPPPKSQITTPSLPQYLLPSPKSIPTMNLPLSTAFPHSVDDNFNALSSRYYRNPISSLRSYSSPLPSHSSMNSPISQWMPYSPTFQPPQLQNQDFPFYISPQLFAPPSNTMQHETQAESEHQQPHMQ